MALSNVGFLEAKAIFKLKRARTSGPAIARGWATLLSFSGSPERTDFVFVVVPCSTGGHSSFEKSSQSTEERATLDLYHNFELPRPLKNGDVG
jgi:hypothetical protein